MNADSQIKCKALVEKYRKTRADDARQRIRNELFCIALPYLYKWVRASLNRKRVFLKQGVILSLCFDSFCFALDAYKNLEVPFPSHFSKNIEYFIISCLLMKNKKNKNKETKYPIEKIFEYRENSISPIKEEAMRIISGPAFLFSFREHLSEEYRTIFDDAITNNKKYLEKYKMPGYKYQEAKKIFRLMVKFFLSEE